MQKISSYLYPNRVQLLVDLAGFTTEYTNVYQRIVKIYKGVDNVIELDVKNADQKRINIATSIDNMRVNLLDASGNGVATYEVNVYPQDGAKKGLAYFTISADSLSGLNPQFLRYSVTHTVAGNPQVLYGDTRFGAMGTMELMGDVIGTVRQPRVYKNHVSEINLNGEVISHSSAIPTKFYEAVPATQMNIHVDIEDFSGVVYVQGTRDSTISVESWKDAPRIMEEHYSSSTTETVHFHPLDILDFNYFRVSWENSSIQRVSLTNPEGLAGRVVQITADVGPGEC
jgi:hypothetical protein